LIRNFNSSARPAGGVELSQPCQDKYLSDDGILFETWVEKYGGVNCSIDPVVPSRHYLRIRSPIPSTVEIRVDARCLNARLTFTQKGLGATNWADQVIVAPRSKFKNADIDTAVEVKSNQSTPANSESIDVVIHRLDHLWQPDAASREWNYVTTLHSAVRLR